MARKAVLDAQGSVVSWIEQPEDGVFVFRQREDETPLLRENAHLRSLPNQGRLRRVASIPTTLVMRWLAEDGINAGLFFKQKFRVKNEYFKRKYNSSDYKHLRTADKRSDWIGA